jgi:hypothetical protein
MANEPASVVMLKLITGVWVSQAIYAAVRLGVPDALAQRPQAAEAFAATAGTDPSATYRLLRARQRGRLSRTTRPALPAHRAGRPAACRQSFRMYAMALTLGDAPYRAWADLVHSVCTGTAAFDHAFGVGWFAYRESHPDAAGAFDHAMAAQSHMAHSGIIESYDFSTARQVLDIGGGSGQLLDQILRRFPQLTGILFDTPRVMAHSATPFWAESPFCDRCQLEAGDFFNEIPRGADVHVLAMVLAQLG